MRQTTPLVVVCLGLLASPGVTRADDDPRAGAIRQSLAAFAQTFNARDADALAKTWRADATYVDQAEGVSLVGREAIREHYAQLFAATPS